MTPMTSPATDAATGEPFALEASRPSDERVVAGRYRLIEPLGRGGMGRVFRGLDELLDRPVAIKLIYDDAVSDRDLQRACAVEARAAARVNHPGVVRMLDSGFDDGHCFVVMELAEGKSLAEMLRERGALSVERALGLAAQVADALEEAHHQGVIHCDVKPGNLVVDHRERVRLVDFGIARVLTSSSGLTDQDIHGSAKYVAPEQVEGGAIDARTDLYSLGVVLFEMLTGAPPFVGDNLASVLAQRLIADPPSVRKAHPSIPAAIDTIVRRAMARDPDRRYQTAGELRDALRAAYEALLGTSRLPLFEGGTGAPRRPARSIGAAHAIEGATRAFGSMRQAGGRAATAVPSLAGRVKTMLPPPSLPSQVKRPSLAAAVGLVALLGLLVGIAAAQCGTVGVDTESALAAPAVDTADRNTARPPLLDSAHAPMFVHAQAPSATAATVLPTPAPAETELPAADPAESAPPPAAEAQPVAPPAAVVAPAPSLRAFTAAPPASAPPVEAAPETVAEPSDEQADADNPQPSGSDGRNRETLSQGRGNDKEPDEKKSDDRPHAAPAAKPQAPPRVEMKQTAPAPQKPAPQPKDNGGNKSNGGGNNGKGNNKH